MKFTLSSFRASILFEDPDYLVVNKPPFLSTLSDRTTAVHLLGRAREYCPTAQACHRLDKDTSGVLVLAKTPEAYRHLSLQFEHRTVAKVYHAVVDGCHSFRGLEVDLPLLKQNDGLVKIARAGKPAQTFFDTLAVYPRHTLVACRPVTGRMHQIRVHLAYCKAPITGDETYGGRPFFLSAVKSGYNLKQQTEEGPLMKRMALHAFSIEFEGLTGKKVRIEAPYPKDFAALVRQLSRLPV